MVTTRADIDDLIAAVLNPAEAGPVTRADATRIATAIADYFDGAVVADVGSAPVVSGLSCIVTRTGGIAVLNFTFTSMAVTHTDAAGSGSSGSIKIFDFAPGAVQPLASRSDLTFLGDALIDTNAGDMAFVFGFGSVAANAGDAALTGTEVDFAAVSGTITLSAKAATSASLLKGVGTAADGTATAVDLYFNESGTAATSDANGVLTVSGTATFVVALLNDD